MKKLPIIFFSLFFLWSCTRKAEPINYGVDVCAYCSMTIVDKAHAAQLVTRKGKNFKFDATECMVKYLEEQNNENQMLYILSANSMEPGHLIGVDSAFFLVSEDVNSPMGASLLALKNEEEANLSKAQFGGKLFDWEGIKKEIAGMDIYNPEHAQEMQEHSHH